ncbi:MAG: hypothetical protein JWM33_131 [Caulobacteraceae bacterium]|nr:hypothetical protein [Caulobacteraceae bacterium]
MTSDSAPPSSAVVDLAETIDKGGWTAAQKLILLMVSCAIVFDGFDNQALGLAAPAIIREWHITKSILSPVIAIGHVGMMVGAALAGFAGDRIGRKTALVASVLLFAVATLAMALVPNLLVLSWLRIIAGLGLGGALPNAAAIVAEYTPARFRHFAVSTCIVCVPLGGVVGGLIAAQLLPAVGWRSLFAFAGGATLVVGLMLTIALPESVRFLLQRRGDSPKLRRILNWVGVQTPTDAILVGARATEAAPAKTSLGALLGRDYRLDTIALWVAFAFSLLASYACFSWLPALIADAGFKLSLSSTGMMAFNLGGVGAALVSAMLIARFGSRAPMLVMTAGALIMALALMLVPLDPAKPTYVMIVWLTVFGAFIAGVQVALYALSAHIYPVAFKATGVGAAASVGRIGAICSAFVGVVIDRFGSSGFYWTVVVSMVVAGMAISMIRHHSRRVV